MGKNNVGIIIAVAIVVKSYVLETQSLQKCIEQFFWNHAKENHFTSDLSLLVSQRLRHISAFDSLASIKFV